MPDDWMSLYFIGEVQHQLGQYQDAISSFTSILVHRPSEVGVLMSLAQSHLELGRMEMSSGFTLRAEQSFVACIRTSLKAIDASPGFRAIAWKIAADAIYDLSDCPSFKLGGCSLPELSTISSILSVELSDRLSGVISSSALKKISAFDELRVSVVAVAAYDYHLSLTSPESPSVGAAWYDLGIALRAWGIKSKSPNGTVTADQQAIRCLKEALRQDPGNTLYWNALGTLNFEEPKVAQHSYIKALEIDSKVGATVIVFWLLVVELSERMS
jgi:superkiller protein 3